MRCPNPNDCNALIVFEKCYKHVHTIGEVSIATKILKFGAVIGSLMFFFVFYAVFNITVSPIISIIVSLLISIPIFYCLISLLISGANIKIEAQLILMILIDLYRIIENKNPLL
jgi:hypothetical protein